MSFKRKEPHEHSLESSFTVQMTPGTNTARFKYIEDTSSVSPSHHTKLSPQEVKQDSIKEN